MSLFLPLISFGFAAFLFLRILRKPEELAVIAIAISSSVPVIQNKYLAFGQKHMYFRFEFLLFALGLFLAYGKWTKHHYIPKSMLKNMVSFMIIIHFMSIIVTKYWGYPVGIGVSIRLIETFIYFFIIVKLTNIKQLGKLVNGFIVVGAAIAIIYLIVSISGSKQLFNILIGGENALEKARYVGGQMVGRGITWWINIEALPIVGVMAFILFLLKKNKIYYGILFFIISVQILTSGQRSSSLALLVGLLFTLIILKKSNYIRTGYSSFIISILFVSIIFYWLLGYTTIFGERFNYLLLRSKSTIIGLQSYRQYIGQILAYQKLNAGGYIAWLLGYGGLLGSEITSAGYDINTPILMVYRFGLVGLITILFLLYYAFKHSRETLYIVQSPEELSVVLGLMLYIIIWLPGAFIRGFVFSENFNTLSWFVVLLAWTEVIRRDIFLFTRIN